jgi:hypothetical protein
MVKKENKRKKDYQYFGIVDTLEGKKSILLTKSELNKARKRARKAGWR